MLCFVVLLQKLEELKRSQEEELEDRLDAGVKRILAANRRMAEELRLHLTVSWQPPVIMLDCESCMLAEGWLSGHFPICSNSIVSGSKVVRLRLQAGVATWKEPQQKSPHRYKRAAACQGPWLWPNMWCSPYTWQQASVCAGNAAGSPSFMATAYSLPGHHDAYPCFVALCVACRSLMLFKVR